MVNKHLARKSKAALADFPFEEIAFSKFVLNVKKSQLHFDGYPVHLGRRAMLLLFVLASNSGKLMERDHLIALVWRGVCVESCNLRTQINNIRKVLSGFCDTPLIVTVPRRGYQFVGRVHLNECPTLDVKIAGNERGRLPGYYVARPQLIDKVVTALSCKRFVTICGPGGIGKSNLAEELARDARGYFTRGVEHVDVSLGDLSKRIERIIAQAFDFEVYEGLGLAELPSLKKEKPFLLILDQCDSDLQEVAALIETLLNKLPKIFILTTSREPLFAHGEYIFTMPALSYVDGEAASVIGPALDSEAAQLLLGCVTESCRTEAVSEHAFDLARICSLLDGNPLAIKVAAGQILNVGVKRFFHEFSLSSVLCAIDEAPDSIRHSSLKACYEFSYASLSGDEKYLFHRLSVFADCFDMAELKSVLPLVNSVAVFKRLVDKSLVFVEARDGLRRYWLGNLCKEFSEQMRNESETELLCSERFRRDKDRVLV